MKKTKIRPSRPMASGRWPILPCQKCGKEFSARNGARSCYSCQKVVSIASLRFKTVEPYRCKGCGNKIKTDVCVLCTARKGTKDAAG